MALGLDCPACGASQASSARPGRSVACRECGASIMVPFARGAAAVTSFSCPTCGMAIESRSKAGKRVRCPGCDSEVRVPFPEKVEAEGVCMACPACRREVRILARPGYRGRCPECRELVRTPLREAPASQTADLGSTPGQAHQSCPECREAVAGGAVVCLNCGADVDAPIQERRFGLGEVSDFDKARGPLAEQWRVWRLPAPAAIVVGAILAVCSPILTYWLVVTWETEYAFVLPVLVPFGLALMIDGARRLMPSGGS